jgi:hypothetical protein
MVREENRDLSPTTRFMHPSKASALNPACAWITRLWPAVRARRHRRKLLPDKDGPKPPKPHGQLPRFVGSDPTPRARREEPYALTNYHALRPRRARREPGTLCFRAEPLPCLTKSKPCCAGNRNECSEGTEDVDVLVDDGGLACRLWVAGHKSNSWPWKMRLFVWAGIPVSSLATASPVISRTGGATNVVSSLRQHQLQCSLATPRL